MEQRDFQNFIPPPPVQRDQQGLAIASLVIGIFGLVAWLVPLCGFPILIAGLVLGIIGRQSSRRGMALTGIILCSIALLLTLINSAIGAYLGMTGQLFK